MAKISADVEVDATFHDIPLMLEDEENISDPRIAGTIQNQSSQSKKKKKTVFYNNEVSETLNSNQSPEDKLKALCDKYSEAMHINRKLMVANKMAESKIVKLQQENEQCQQIRSKAVLTRSRLENLCREFQKLNKAQKEEIDLKLRLEEERRKELTAKFQSAFAEMNTLTNQNTEKNTKMHEENLEMREKIRLVCERVELSEQQLEKVRKQAQLELQLAEAKMATVKIEMTAEKESLLKEKQQLLLNLNEYQMHIRELQAAEVGLKNQISMYTEKYDVFQDALTKSNGLLNGFNDEIKKMSKKILKLEKETSLWKQRWQKSHAALLEMAADKQTRDTEMTKQSRKLSLLQELCQAFQRERADLLAQLRAANITNSYIYDPKNHNSSVNEMQVSPDPLITCVTDDVTKEKTTLIPPIDEIEIKVIDDDGNSTKGTDIDEIDKENNFLNDQEKAIEMESILYANSVELNDNDSQSHESDDLISYPNPVSLSMQHCIKNEKDKEEKIEIEAHAGEKVPADVHVENDNKSMHVLTENKGGGTHTTE